MSHLGRTNPRGFRRAFYISLFGHLGFALWLSLHLVFDHPPEPPQLTAVDIEYESAGPPSRPHKADHASKTPAPAPSDHVVDAPPSPEPPKPQPVEESPPPAPPPPPIPPSASSAVKPLEKLPDVKPVDDTEQPVKAPPSPPKPPTAARELAPPSAHPVPKVARPKHPKVSRITQPNPTQNSLENSHSLLASLNALKIDQRQTHPPKHLPNAARGGALNGGGAPDGDITHALTASDQKAIGLAVRRCYVEDTQARDFASFSAHLIVTIDASGVVRLAEFARDTASRAARDPAYRALAERARDAVLSSVCAKLPVPQRLLGETRTLRFEFRP